MNLVSDSHRLVPLDWARFEILMNQCQETGNVAGTAAEDEDTDLPQCCICQKSMNHRSGEELMALECSHVFHTQCITECWEKLHKPRFWCPYKCNQCPNVVEDDDHDDFLAVDADASAADDSAVGAAGQGSGVFEVIM